MRNAENLGVEELISDCRAFVEQEVTASNCIKLIVCAKEMGREEIEKRAFNYFLVSTPFSDLEYKLKTFGFSLYQISPLTSVTPGERFDVALALLVLFDMQMTNSTFYMTELPIPCPELLDDREKKRFGWKSSEKKLKAWPLFFVIMDIWAFFQKFCSRKVFFFCLWVNSYQPSGLCK